MKKIFFLFILLLSSVILLSHQSFSKSLTGKYFIDYQDEEDNDSQDNNDNDNGDDKEEGDDNDQEDDGNNDGQEEDDDDDNDGNDQEDNIDNKNNNKGSNKKDSNSQKNKNNQDHKEVNKQKNNTLIAPKSLENENKSEDESTEYSEEEEEEDERDKIFTLKVIFCVVFAIFIFISTLFFVYILKGRNEEDNSKKINYKDANDYENSFNSKHNDSHNPEEVKKRLLKRDAKLVSKVGKCSSTHESILYSSLLGLDAPDFFNKKGFPCFYERRDGEIVYGYSLINFENNKLYNLTECQKKGSFFSMAESYFNVKEMKLNDLLDEIVNEINIILQANSYLNFTDNIRYNSKKNISNLIEGYIKEYTNYSKNVLSEEEKNKLIEKEEEFNESLSKLHEAVGIKKLEENEEELRKESNEISQFLFDETYRKIVKIDIMSLIEFLYIRSIINVGIQKKSLESLAKFFSFEEEDNKMIKDENDYVFFLYPRNCPNVEDKELWKKNILGNAEGKEYLEPIKIKINKSELRENLRSIGKNFEKISKKFLKPNVAPVKDVVVRSDNVDKDIAKNADVNNNIINNNPDNIEINNNPDNIPLA